jgi:D-3-phosphoglycerate dehydrogenase
MGKAFAKKLRGFDCEVLCHDIKEGVGDENAQQVALETLFDKAEVLSLHTPQTPLTVGMVNTAFINRFKHPFYLINTARGSAVVTSDLMKAIESGQVLGACLDVLEYEKTSFEDFFADDKLPEGFQKLINSDKVLLSPHVAGWTVESKFKLADTIVQKVRLFLQE